MRYSKFRTSQINSNFLFLICVAISLFSCTNKAPVTTNPGTEIKSDTVKKVVLAPSVEKVLEKNGEHIEYYKNGVIKIRGRMKDGKRDGVWKSWYEDGTPWSETEFKEGKKTGKTTTWFENGKKRYEGFFMDNTESGKWIFWDENGNLVNTKNY